MIVAEIIVCVALYTGLPVAPPPAGGVITAPLTRLCAYYVPHGETIIIGCPDPDHFLLALELTHHLQRRAGIPMDERQAWNAARHWIQAC